MMFDLRYYCIELLTSLCKGPKENRFHPLQQNLEVKREFKLSVPNFALLLLLRVLLYVLQVTQLVKERTPFMEKQSQYGNGIAATEAGSRFSARYSRLQMC